MSTPDLRWETMVDFAALENRYDTATPDVFHTPKKENQGSAKPSTPVKKGTPKKVESEVVTEQPGKSETVKKPPRTDKKKGWIEYEDLPRSLCVKVWEIEEEIEIQKYEADVIKLLHIDVYENPKDFKHYLYQYYDIAYNWRLDKMRLVRFKGLQDLKEQRQKEIIAKVAEKKAELNEERLKKQKAEVVTTEAAGKEQK